MITTSELQLLREQAGKKRLVTNEYLIDKNNPNFKYVASKFFNGRSNTEVQLLNNGSGLFASVANTVAIFVGSPVIDVNFPMRKMVLDFETFGFAVFGIEKINNKYTTVYQPAESYFTRNGVDYIVRCYEDRKDNGLEIDYYYLETEHNNGIIYNRLYKGDFNLGEAQEVPLDTIYETANLSPIVNSGLSKAVFVVKEDELEQFPVSEIDKITNMVYSADRKVVMIDQQALENVESFILLKGINIPAKLLQNYQDGKKIEFSQLGRLVMGNDGSSIEFVKNKNDLLVDIKNYIKDELSRISAVTNIPLDFLGMADMLGPIGEGSRTILHNAFVKKIQNIRACFDKTILEALEVIGEDSSYTWQDVFSKTTMDLLNENILALNNNLISKETAMRNVYDWTDEEVANEVKLIQNNLTIPNETN
ncbi:MAG TPA: hypothetical protein PLQ36_00600 [Candidatus Gracilibacteria bacterium]|nr:hypothetical protein [Candidatus Gracilibacteria bacterium]